MYFYFLHSQLLLPKPADNTSSGETTHSHSLRNGFHGRSAIANSKDAGYFGFVERRIRTNDTLLIYAQAELFGEGSVGFGRWCCGLVHLMLAFHPSREELKDQILIQTYVP